MAIYLGLGRPPASGNFPVRDHNQQICPYAHRLASVALLRWHLRTRRCNGRQHQWQATSDDRTPRQPSVLAGGQSTRYACWCAVIAGDGSNLLAIWRQRLPTAAAEYYRAADRLSSERPCVWRMSAACAIWTVTYRRISTARTSYACKRGRFDEKTAPGRNVGTENCVHIVIQWEQTGRRSISYQEAW